MNRFTGPVSDRTSDLSTEEKGDAVKGTAGSSLSLIGKKVPHVQSPHTFFTESIRAKAGPVDVKNNSRRLLDVASGVAIYEYVTVQQSQW